MKTHILGMMSVFIALNAFVGVSQATNNYTEEKIACKMSGCQISCAYKDTNWKSFGNVDSLTMTMYDSGAIKMQLEKGIDGRTTIVTGPQGYICSVENQKD
ncbi:hypothetical protein [Azotobacter salinestris]|uniref:hypothetical protein n=1 Tax=Azotobacter salinestris TaxID=69964 RepID=UPI0012668C9F|nr:hypothetical protein [Azotobacter salinestris]